MQDPLLIYIYIYIYIYIRQDTEHSTVLIGVTCNSCVLVTLTDCQVKELTKWDKLFTMLENSQMRENMLLQTVDEVLKVELQTLRAELTRFTVDIAGKYRLDGIERALKQKSEDDEEQKNRAPAECKQTEAALDGALQDLESLKSTLELTQKWVNKRSLPADCDSAILFPMRSPKIYASVHPVEMTLEAFTFCTWIRVTEALEKTIVFSYGTKKNPYEIQLYLNNRSPVLVIGGEKNKVSADDVVEPGQWSQLCGAWSIIEGNVAFWANGELIELSSNVSKGRAIPDRGIFQLGQEKNGCCVGGGFDESLAFSGKITGFNVWDRVLSEKEISETRGENGCNIRGNIVGWGTTEIQPHGGSQYIH
uniref:Pentraxin-related protein PTX3 n=1 Tax=Leptobrachium leishanense TaxID=445787 RepID=A0A8C5MZF7_9ANUR